MKISEFSKFAYPISKASVISTNLEDTLASVCEQKGKSASRDHS